MVEYDFSALDEDTGKTEQYNFNELDAQKKTSEFLDANSDKDVVNSLPDKLKIGFYQSDIPLNEDVSAFLVGAGHMMTDVYRGVKQLIGFDEDQMQEQQRIMNDLYADDEVGGSAVAGAITGALAEPIGFMLPGMKAASVGKAALKGAGIGAAYGTLSYVDEDKGQSRLGNAAIGGTLGGALGGIIKKTTNVLSARKVSKATSAIEDLEKRWASKVLEGKTTPDIRKELLQETPKLNIKSNAKLAGRNPSLVSTPREAQQILDYHTVPIKQNDLVVGLDKAVGIVSTRVRNISEPVFGRLRLHDMNVHTRTHNLLESTSPFLDGLSKKIPESDRNKISSALFNGDHDIVKDILKKHGGDELVQNFETVQKTLNELGDELVSSGRLSDKLDNYFPRFVKDKEGLFGHIGKVERSRIEEALSAANAKVVASRGYKLSPLEESEVINKALRGYPVKEYRPGFAKQRKIQNVSEELLPYYASPEESLHSYVRNAINDLEKIKFFGKDIKYKKVNGTNFLDVDESVGAVVQKELTSSNLSHTQQRELESLLSTRFGIGEKSPAALVQDTKNIMYASLLGNPVSAATQLGDLGVSIYINGFRNTLKSVVKNISGKEISAREFGLLDNMAEEFATTSKMAKFLHGSLKWSGFRSMDKFGKDTFITASLSKFRKLASTEKGRSLIRNKYGKVFGDELGDLLSDLNKGSVSDNVKVLLYNEIADIQPVSLSEVPEMYLKMPNGRVAYMLKTFMLKQLDVIRREAYQEIKKGNVTKGVSNLMKYGVAVGAANTGSQYIKDWMLGKDVEKDIPADMASNLFKTFGWSEYLSNKVASGKPVEATMDVVLPPFTMFDKILQTDEKALQYMPIAGRMWYYWFGGGIEDFNKKQTEKKYKKYQDRYKERGD